MKPVSFIVTAATTTSTSLCFTLYVSQHTFPFDPNHPAFRLRHTSKSPLHHTALYGPDLDILTVYIALLSSPRARSTGCPHPSRLSFGCRLLSHLIRGMAHLEWLR